MKTYTFEKLDRIKAGIRAISYLLFLFTLLTLLAFYTGLAGLCILIMFVLISLPIIFYKKLIPVFEETIFIYDTGFHIKSQNRTIEWENIKWFKIDNSTSPLVDLIEFGIENGKNVSFSFYKKTQNVNDWQLFKSDIKELVNNNCENLKNYYDSKVWQIIMYVIIISWIIVPLVLFVLGFSLVKMIPSFLIYIGSTIPLITLIINNKKKKIK
jgi:hypothetical protein